MSDHVVFDAAAQAMRCHHCGAVKSLPMPTPILEACQRLNAFADLHKDCRRQPEGIDSEGGACD